MVLESVAWKRAVYLLQLVTWPLSLAHRALWKVLGIAENIRGLGLAYLPPLVTPPGLSLETSVGSAPNPGDPGASGQPGWRSQGAGNSKALIPNPLSLKCSSDLGFPKKIIATQRARRKSLLPSLLTAVSSVPFLRAQGGGVPVRQAGAKRNSKRKMQR